MEGFIEGKSRSQSTLFPERFDDYISEDSAVRVVDGKLYATRKRET